jgi:hypothetical protein
LTVAGSEKVLAAKEGLSLLFHEAN